MPAGGIVKTVSLTRRIHAESWVAGKLLRKKVKKPRGKILCSQPEAIRTNPLACVAFAGQCMRTHTAAQDAGLGHLLGPLRAHMTQLGL